MLDRPERPVFLIRHRSRGRGVARRLSLGPRRAPISTHRRSAETECSGSLVLGGIFSSSCVCATACTSRLSSGLPGTMAGPVVPPSSMARRLSSRKPDDCFAGPWHLKHDSESNGRTEVSKKSQAARDDASAARAAGSSAGLAVPSPAQKRQHHAQSQGQPRLPPVAHRREGAKAHPIRI